MALYDYVSNAAGHNVAGAYLDRVEAACMPLSTFPARGNARDDLFPGLRIIGFERRASIAFVVGADEVRILRIFYGAAISRKNGQNRANLAFAAGLIVACFLPAARR